MDKDTIIKVNDVVQLNPKTTGAFAGCFMIISEIKYDGAMGFVQIPGDKEKRGQAFFRARFEDMELIGTSMWSIKEYDK